MPHRALQPETIAHLLRASLLVLDGAAPPRPDTAKSSRGRISDLDEAADLLTSLPDGEARWGCAFNRSWPYWQGDDGRVATPAVPGVVGPAETELVDGRYRQDGRAIVRTASGPERRLLELRADADHPSSGPGLVWFGPSERYFAAAGRVEIEDAFSRWVLPWTPDVRERLLLGPHRLPGAFDDGLVMAGRDADTEGEVARDLRLIRSARWRDPAHLLAGRVEVVAVTSIGDHLHLRLAGDQRCELLIEATEHGWTASRTAGPWPYESLSLEAHEGFLRCRARVAAGIDATVSGARAAITFDLMGGLVVIDD